MCETWTGTLPLLLCNELANLWKMIRVCFQPFPQVSVELLNTLEGPKTRLSAWKSAIVQRPTVHIRYIHIFRIRYVSHFVYHLFQLA
jgi:hypothetical protein